MILLGLGLVFELPILIFFLSLFGIVTPSFLWKNFRYAILVIGNCGGGDYANAGCGDHADFHVADGGIVFCGDGGVRGGGAEEEEEGRGGEGGGGVRTVG